MAVLALSLELSVWCHTRRCPDVGLWSSKRYIRTHVGVKDAGYSFIEGFFNAADGILMSRLD